ncbi:hypothetical protein [Variovorax paradoxus]
MTRSSRIRFIKHFMAIGMQFGFGLGVLVASFAFLALVRWMGWA